MEQKTSHSEHTTSPRNPVKIEEEERLRLARFCPCAVCSTPLWLMWLYMFVPICPHCCGCLYEVASPAQDFVDEARKRMGAGAAPREPVTTRAVGVAMGKATGIGVGSLMILAGLVSLVSFEAGILLLALGFIPVILIISLAMILGSMYLANILVDRYPAFMTVFTFFMAGIVWLIGVFLYDQCYFIWLIKK